MLECEGYKMFRGTATVTPKNPKFPTEVISGTWLYKPEYDCWYVNGRSYTADIVSEFVEFQPTVDKWISVEEQLPEIKDHHVSDCVLCYTEESAYAFSELEENIIGQTVFSCEKPDPCGIEWEVHVTHWMPLPSPPEDA